MSRRKVKANPQAESSPLNSLRAVSPNAVLEVQKLKELLEAEKEKGQFRVETISLLKNDKTYLQGELQKKDELIQELLSKKDEDNSTIMSGKSGVKRKHGKGKKAKQLMSIASDKEDEDSSSALSDSSEDSSMNSYQIRSPSSSTSSRKVKNNDDPMRRRGRARNTRSIVARYKMALDAFNKGGSMKAAFDTIGADRNTVSRTAPIAELSIAAPDIFKNVGAWDERKEKLSTFISRCRSAVTPEVKERILQMKEEGTLLPIATQV